MNGPTKEDAEALLRAAATIYEDDPAAQAVIAERIDSYRDHCTVIQKIRTRTAMKTLFAELENYAGSELDADYS